jgi:hypothetical protein
MQNLFKGHESLYTVLKAWQRRLPGSFLIILCRFRRQPGCRDTSFDTSAHLQFWVPESLTCFCFRDIKWSPDGSAGNATARVYPTQADPQRARPQLSGAEATYAAYAGTGAGDARSHTLDRSRMASNSGTTGAAFQGPSLSWLHNLNDAH